MSAGDDDSSAFLQSKETKSADPLGETAYQNQETPAVRPQPSGSFRSPQSWIGEKLGKYEVTGVLGQGGMGIVFRAHDPLIERDVAIKLLAEHLTEDQTALARFLAEARAAGKLSHPNVTAIYEICQEGPRYFLVMELLAGGSLGDELEERGACSVLDATRTMIDVCRGVAAAHAAGLIHRDIKPANFMRAADRSVKVTDFGLVKTMSDTTRGLTISGAVLGTPYFMSPEQCMSLALDARADIYSLGATYYCLLTGKHPYDDTVNVPQLMMQHCHGPIPDPRQIDASIPPACAEIVARAMAKAPDDRYQSADEMLADLEAVVATLSGQTQIWLPSASGTGRGVSSVAHGPVCGQPGGKRAVSRRYSIAAAGLLGIALIAGGAYFWRSGGGANGASSDGANPALAAAPSSDDPIKVGVLHSLSGTMATSGTVVVDATLFAIEEINASGGLLGRRVVPVVFDGRSDPANFAREAKRLIEEEHVVAIFGCWTSAGRKAVLPVVEERDHLLFYPLQYEGLESSPNIVYLGAAPNQQILPALEWAVEELGKQRFYLVGSDYVFPRAANEVIKDYLLSQGAEIVGESYLPLGSPHADPIVEQIAAARPDIILNTINGDSNVAFFRELREMGVRPEEVPCISFSIGEQELRSLNAAEMAGDYAAWTYFETVDTPENRDFLRRFHEKYPQRTVNDPMEAAYTSVLLWAQAVKEAGSDDPKKVRRALLNARLAAPDGELRIDAETQHAYKTPRIGQIQADGSFQIVWTAPAPVKPEPYPASRTAADWKAFLHDLYNGWGQQWSAPAGEAQPSGAP